MTSQAPLRIVHIIPTAAPCWARQQLRLVVRDLPAERYRSQICVLHGEPDQAVAQLFAPAGDATRQPVEWLGSRHIADAAAWRHLLTLVRSFQPDILHAWSFEALRWASVAGRLAGVRRVVLSQPDGIPAEPWIWRGVDRQLLSAASAWIANCEGSRAALAPDPNVARRGHVIGGGVEPPVEHPTRTRLLDELGIAQDAIVVGAVGQLGTHRGWKGLIWATDMLKFMHCHVHMLIVGQGPRRWRLERFTRQARVEDRVHFLGVREDLAQWLGGLDAFWSACLGPGQPLALLEAMAAALPVVSTNVPGAADLIEHGRNGYLVTIGDRSGFARWTNLLVEKPHLRKVVGDAARQDVLTRFAPATMVEHVARVYDSLASNA